MKRAERAALVFQRLNELYPNPAVPLRHSDPYTLLIAVLLSAQCTDERVNKITPRLFAVARTPAEMAKLPVEKIREIIKPCGLAPRKSQAILQLSAILLNRHQARVPESFEALEALPGVGHKTASVVMAQAFGVPAFPVDTHIHRLAQRWGLTGGRNVKQTERDLKRCFPEKDWNRLHLQFIHFGREFCTARGCDGTRCDICRLCFPLRKKAKLTRKA